MTERGHERPLGDEDAGRRRVTHVVDQYLRAIDPCHASGVCVRQQARHPTARRVEEIYVIWVTTLASTGMTGFRGACSPFKHRQDPP